MATYKITNNCLLFFSAKFFLDSINTIFQFRFVETNDCKWILEYRLLDELIWQRKPISICLTTTHVEVNNSIKWFFKFVHNDDTNFDEDVHLLKMYYTLHTLMVEAMNSTDLILPENYVSVSDIQLRPPYHFKEREMPAWQQVPGQTTIRISNAGYKIKNSVDFADIYLAFNVWKYRKVVKNQSSNKKRKMESEIVPETISNEILCKECQPMEIKTEA